MFGPSTTFSTPTAFGQPSSFNYFHSNGDYNTWGSQLGQRKYEDYYRDAPNMYTQAVPDSIKSVEQAMQILGELEALKILGFYNFYKFFIRTKSAIIKVQNLYGWNNSKDCLKGNIIIVELLMNQSVNYSCNIRWSSDW